MKRTIVYFTDSPGFGGAEQALLHLLAGLDRRRWRPALWHHDEPGLAPLLEGARDLDVEAHAVPRMPLGRRGAVRMPQFVRALHAAQPAVFHAHLTWPLACKYGLVGAVLARVPAVVATAQLFIDLPYTRATRIQQRLLAAGVHRYIAVSHEVARRLRQTFGIPERKIEVIYNAVAPDRFAASDGSACGGAIIGRAGQSVILTLARLNPQKGLCYLLEAAVQVPEALFVLAGDGSERSALEARANALGIADRVVFLGHRRDVPELLAGCDLLVLPSLYEGLPLSVLEAMAAGRPVVATAIGGTDEAVVHGKTGLLVPPADPDALAGAIRTILRDPQLAQRLAEAGQARARQRFSVAAMVGCVAELYDRLLGGAV